MDISNKFTPIKNYCTEWHRHLIDKSSYPGLDFMRAIAIAMVLVWHYDSFNFRFGWIGVDLFFILSGFLISTAIIKQIPEKFNLRRYFINRFLRIYPLYIFSICAWILLQGTPLNESLALFLIHALFLQTIYFDLTGISVNYFQITWSLVVEVLFYLVVPFFLISLLRLKGIIVGLIIFIICFIVARFWLSQPYSENDNNWQFFLFLRPYYRLDELFFGVGVGLLAYGESQQNKVFSLIMGIIIIILTSFYIHFLPGANSSPSMALLTRDGVFLPTVLALGFSLIVFGTYKLNISSGWINCVARLAYPLYLLHMFALHVVNGFFAYLVLSFLFSFAASFFIEYPFIRLYKGNSGLKR